MSAAILVILLLLSVVHIRAILSLLAAGVIFLVVLGLVYVGQEMHLVGQTIGALAAR